MKDLNDHLKDNLNNDLNSGLSGSAPLTSKQFLSFETIAAGLFALFVSVCIYVWHDHSDDFKQLKGNVKELQADVKTIGVAMPTLATKVEMDVKLEKLETKMETRFDKVNAKMDRKFNDVNTKLDALILSVNTIQNTMVTKAEFVELSEKVAVHGYRLDKIEEKIGLKK